MDIERIVVRLVADASQYLRVLDSTQARLAAFGGFVGGYFSRQAIQLAADYERAAIAFEVMTKSAGRGRQLLNEINALAIESPFTSAQLRTSAKQVMAFGFDVDDVIPIISRLGDVSVATGTDMDRLTLALGQVRTTGRLMGQELRQFTNAGVPILEYLAKSMGVSSSAVPQLVRQGKVSFNDVADALNRMTNEGGLFFGMMNRINKETVSGRWANLTESIQLTGMALGGAFFEAFRVKETLADLGEAVRGMKMEDARNLFSSLRLVVFSFQKGIEWLTATLVKHREVVLAVVAAYVLLKTAAIAVSLISGIGAFVVAWGPWLMLLVATAATIYILVERLNVLDSSLSRISDTLSRMSPVLQEAMAGIQNAMQGGNVELAFEILSEGIKLIWKALFMELTIMTQRGVAGMVTAVIDAIGEVKRRIGNNTAFALLFPGQDLLVDQGDKIKNHLDQWAARNEKGFRDKFGRDLTESRGKIQGLAIHAEIAKNFPKGTFGGDIAESIYHAVLGPNGRGIRGAEQFPIQYGLLGGPKSGVGGALVLSRQSELFKNAADAMMKVQMKIANPNIGSKSLEMLKSEAEAATKKLEDFQKAIGKVKEAARDISKAFQLSPEAVKAAMEVQKEFDRGTSALQRFTNQIRYLREASVGNFKPGLGAILPQFGIQNIPEPALGLDAAQFGIFQAFKSLQKEVGGGRDRYAPAMVAGSREAADVIIRSRDQQLTVEQQVLQTLRDAKIIQEQQAAYAKRVVEILSNNKDAARAAGLPGS